MLMTNFVSLEQEIDKAALLSMTEFTVKELFLGEPIGKRVRFYDLLRKLQMEQDQLEIVSVNNYYFFVIF